MNILIDILHPAHVHFFRYAIGEWERHGHRVKITLRDKDIAATLLERLGLAYENLGPPAVGLSAMAVELLRRDVRMWRVARRFRPDVMVGIGGISIAHVGWLCRIPALVFTDTENATLSNRLTFPFAAAVLTPSCFEASVTSCRRHIGYAGYHELAYTHPRRFRPDPAALREFGLREDDRVIVVRLIAWQAAHDVGDRGFSDVGAALRRLQRFGRVVVTAEGAVPAELVPYRIQAAPELIHHLLWYATLYVGESATMASESATLGTPAIFISTSVRGYTNEQERTYDLMYTFSDPQRAQDQALAKAEELLSDPDLKAKWRVKRDRMLTEKIDVTEFIVQTIEAWGRGGMGVRG
jgi:predicted glycosyltransferase